MHSAGGSRSLPEDKVLDAPARAGVLSAAQLAPDTRRKVEGELCAEGTRLSESETGLTINDTMIIFSIKMHFLFVCWSRRELRLLSGPSCSTSEGPQNHE